MRHCDYCHAAMVGCQHVLEGGYRVHLRCKQFLATKPRARSIPWADRSEALDEFEYGDLRAHVRSPECVQPGCREPAVKDGLCAGCAQIVQGLTDEMDANPATQAKDPFTGIYGGAL